MSFQLMNLTPGQKFTLLRQQARRTKAKTARLLDISAQTYTRLEGDYLYPSDTMLRKIAGLYDLTYDELLAVGEYDLIICPPD